MKYLLAMLMLTAACSKSSTGPAGIDPSVLVVNWSDDTARVTWASDVGLSTVSVAPRATLCTRWTQSFDSLYVRVTAGGVATLTAPWLHFADYPYYFQVDTVYGSTGGRGATPGGPASYITNHIALAEC